MKIKTKKANKKAYKVMEKEINEILRTTDYSTYHIAIYPDALAKRFLVPKPVFALSLVDDNVSAWLTEQLNKRPEYAVVIH